MDMTANPVVHMLRNCQTVAPVLAQVGDKWTVLIIVTLQMGPRRFNDIKRTVDGISQQMLTRTLKTLERDGMVIRTAFPTTPPQVQYELSALGHSLAEPVLALAQWVERNVAQIKNAREKFDARL